MQFRQFFNEMYIAAQEERVSWGDTPISASEYAKNSKWYIRKAYRCQYGRLQPKWEATFSEEE